MRDFRDAKAMGGSLRKALQARGYSITHSDSLELISNAFGFDNWNILSAKIEAAKPSAEPAISSAAASAEPRDTLYCTFCGRSQHEVQKLIAGPGVFICDACVGRCNGILGDEAITKLLELPQAQAVIAFAEYSTEKLTAYRDGMQKLIEANARQLPKLARDEQGRRRLAEYDARLHRALGAVTSVLNSRDIQ